MSWDEPEEVTRRQLGYTYDFPSLLFDSDGVIHLITRTNADYDEDCSPQEQNCPQEARQVFYVNNGEGEWQTQRISAHWTSTVPELDWAPSGGSGGDGGRGRLWAAWHNEIRPEGPVGCTFDDVSVWSLDLDSGQASLETVTGSWAGEACDAEFVSALYPSIALGANDLPHIVHAQLTGSFELQFFHQAKEAGGTWTAPEAIHELPVSSTATLAIGDDGRLQAFVARSSDDDGQLLWLVAGEQGWTETVLDQSVAHGFNLPNVSRRPIEGGGFGVLYGAEGVESGAGELYFARPGEPDAD